MNSYFKIFESEQTTKVIPGVDIILRTELIEYELNNTNIRSPLERDKKKTAAKSKDSYRISQ